MNRSQTRSSRLSRLAFALPLVLALGACSAVGSGAASVNSQSKPGGTLVYLDAEASVSTQPQSAGTWQDSAYIENITDRLVWKDPKTHELKPYIATKWQISDDGKRYQFWIRPGVTYSDGTPLDAESVKRNLEWQANGDPGKGIPPSTSWPAVQDIAVDGDSVVVDLKQAYSPLLDVLSGWSSSLVADKTIDEPLEKQQQITGIIGSGPFVVSHEKYGEEIDFTKRKGYDWAPQGAGHQGEAYLDKVEVHAVTDDTVRIGTFQAKQADAIRYIQPSNEKVLEKSGFQVLSAQGLGATNQWILKQQVLALQDIRVRQAIQSGIDRQQIVKELYTSNWSVAKSIVTADTPGFVDESAKLAYDPGKANTLLDQAGYTERDADGYRTKDGKELKLYTVIDVYDSTSKPLYQLVQLQLKKLGINLQLREADYSQVSQAYSAPDVAATRSGWPYPAPWVTLRTSWLSTGANGFKLPKPDAELDGLLQKQLTATDDASRDQLLGQLQDYVIDNAYSIPIINDSQIFAVQPTVHDFSWSAEARPLFYDAWTSKK